MADPNANNCPPVTADCDGKPTPTFQVNAATGPYVAPNICVGTLDLSVGECADKESAYVSGLMAEALQIAGGPVNVFPLLGVHSQGSTIDQAQDGFPLSSGTAGGFNVQDAFNVNDAAWKSVQTGAAVLSAPAYLGYDFGTKKAWGGTTERYFPAAPIRKRVATIKLRQGDVPETRALQIRVEASDDGVTWKRIDVIRVANTDQLVTLSVKPSSEYNKWRIIPTFFNGITANEGWEVAELHLIEANQVSIDNIEDFVLLENRDRAYCRSSVLLKAQYDLLDVQTELARFGVNLPQTYIFTVNFAMMVKELGRPIVVGDVVELPGEVQYDANLRPVRKWLEVTDTAWSTEGYTVNWKPQLFKFYAEPILPSVEHKDLLGVPGQVNATQSDDDVLLNGFLQNDIAYKAAEEIKQQATDAAPQDGADPQDVQSGMSLKAVKGSYDGRDLYAEDALPPDGASYTVGDTLPDVGTITDGHYHRQTYTNVPISIRPADRLLRWFADVQRWRVIEVNRRNTPESHKKTVSKIMSSSEKRNLDDK